MTTILVFLRNYLQCFKSQPMPISVDVSTMAESLESSAEIGQSEMGPNLGESHTDDAVI